MTSSEKTPWAWIPPCFPEGEGISIGDSGTIWREYPEKFLIAEVGNEPPNFTVRPTHLEFIGPTKTIVKELSDYSFNEYLTKEIRGAWQLQQRGRRSTFEPVHFKK